MPRRYALDQLRQGRALAVAPDPTEERPPRVGSYERISDAYEDGLTEVTTQGVDRQSSANELIAQARGWVVHRHYVDNDVSAFKDVVRDAWEDLLADLSAGVIDGIVCYNLDRFARRPVDLERAVAIYDEARQRKRELVFATAQGDLNLASDDGLTMARVMVAFANKASRDTGRRVALQQQDSRDSGKPFYATRPLGLRQDADGRWVIDEAEAERMRAGIAAITEGTMTWGAITQAWNAAGFRTTKGNAWTSTTVKSCLRSPRVAGWLVHKGVIAEHSRTGELVRADVPQIVSDQQYEEFLAADEANAARFGTRTNGHGSRTFLLTAIARCAECGGPLQGNNVKRPGGKTYPYYRCSSNARASDGENGCGQVSISATGLDDLVVNLVLPRLIEDSAEAAVDAEPPGSAELHDLRAEKDQVLTAYREGRATSEIAFPRATAIEAEIERLRKEQADWRRTARVGKRAAGITKETWPALSLAERTAHVSEYIEAVYVTRRSSARSNRFDPSRVLEPVWRKRDGER